MDAPTVVLETLRLRLRTVTAADAEFFLRLLNEPSWLENIGDRGVRSREDAERYIMDTVRAPYQALGYGMYAVQRKSTTLPIGICGLVKRDFLPAPDLGVALLPDFAGQGYATEAARAVILHARGKLGIERLYALVQRGNQRSVRLLERLGFHREGPCPTPPGTDVELFITR
jgi:RimJ/RimL family protein N-acetyltransferase